MIGSTLRELSDMYNISERTILRWQSDYSYLLINKITQKPMSVYIVHLDEIFVRMRGTFYYLWDGIDSVSKWLFTEFTDNRTKQSARKLLRHIPPPHKIYTDDCFSYREPIRERYGVYFKQKNHVYALEKINVKIT